MGDTWLIFVVGFLALYGVASLPSDEFDFTNTRNIEDSLVQSKMSANTKRSFDPDCSVAYKNTEIIGSEYILLKSPNFPDKYLNDYDCGWSLQSAAETQISVACPVIRLAHKDNITITDAGNSLQVSDDLSNWSYNYIGNVGTFGLETTELKHDRGFICAAYASPCECGRKKVSRIVGGADAVPHEYPWVIGLYGRGIFCSAVLINDRWAMTTASCIPTSEFWISLARHEIYLDHAHDFNIMRNPRDIVYHPDYNGVEGESDLALFNFDPINFVANDFVRPACLPADTSATYAGATATITGWGRKSQGGRYPAVLQEADIQVWENTACENALGISIPSNVLCAGAYGKDTCENDSGAALVVARGFANELVGIAISPACEEGSKPGRYVRITEYVPWILDVTSNGLMCVHH